MKVLAGVGITAAAIILTMTPAPASAAEYSTFVGCDDLAEEPLPSHVCTVGDFPGAYFESDVVTEYEVCVEFPNGKELCADEQFAEAETLYVNSITSEIPGNHFVTWWVEGVEVGSWAFRLDPPPSPPAPVVVVPQAPAPITLAPAPSAACLKAEQQVGKLKARLHQAEGRKQRVKLRTKLKAARSAAQRAC